MIAGGRGDCHEIQHLQFRTTAGAMLVGMALTGMLAAGGAPAAADPSPGGDLDVACDAWFARKRLVQSFNLFDAIGAGPDVRES